MHACVDSLGCQIMRARMRVHVRLCARACVLIFVFECALSFEEEGYPAQDNVHVNEERWEEGKGLRGHQMEETETKRGGVADKGRGFTQNGRNRDAETEAGRQRVREACLEALSWKRAAGCRYVCA